MDSLLKENENLKEDMKQLLREKIEGERMQRKQNNSKEDTSSEQQMFKLELLSLQQKAKTDQQIIAQQEEKIKELEAKKPNGENISLKSKEDYIKQIEKDKDDLLNKIDEL